MSRVSNGAVISLIKTTEATRSLVAFFFPSRHPGLSKNSLLACVIE
jgi:hypothetical protein